MKSSVQKKNIEVSVIIVNYNVRDFLHQALLSIQKSLKGIISEIIVVDNASDDGSIEMLKSKFPTVNLIVNNENLGFAKANNIAIKQARGKFLLLINPDTIVQEDTIRVMLDFMHSRPQVGLAGCKMISPDGNFEPACRRSYPTPWVAFTRIIGLSKLFPRSELFAKYNLTYLSTEETYPVDAVSGAFMFVRKEVVKQVGGLDEQFFMYGEDLDWCYRINKAGWQVYYVHSTQIIHFKGQSTKRSNIDKIRTFYDAMRIFVEKHFHSSWLFSMFLKFAIKFVSFIAFLNSVLKPLRIALIDFVIITISILLAEKIRRGAILSFPDYAYPTVFIVPALILIISLYLMGVYTFRYMSISRSVIATFISYVIISAITAFFKDYAFSRGVVLISGLLAVLLIPGWRIILVIFGKTTQSGRAKLIQRKTLIVGTNKEAVELCKKLRVKVAKGYDVVGYIGKTHKDIGKTLIGIKIIGSLENIGKIIREQNISEVIFAPGDLSYSEILAVISKCRDQTVSFHIVPTAMDIIVGKTMVDTLDDIPLMHISYNINNPFNAFKKRVFDICLSTLLLITVYPVYNLLLLHRRKRENSFINYIPKIFKGEMSFVGPPRVNGKLLKRKKDDLFLGKQGVFGFPQLQEGKLSAEEIYQYNIYYARNQSLLLDIEILIKSFLKNREN